MNEQRDLHRMLDLMIRPGFCVKNGEIEKVNQAAQGFFLNPGTPVESLLLTGKEEYREFTDGCLFLTLSLCGQTFGASVTRMEDSDIFLLEQESANQELQSMALTARELRQPLSGVMATAAQLFPMAAQQEEKRSQVGQMNRNLFQMMRILNNMSDVSRYASVSHPENLAIRDELNEIFQKAQSYAEAIGIHMHYTASVEELYCLADKEQLERAVLNMLSNAIKFTPAGGTVEVDLTRRGRMLRLSITDSGVGIPDEIRSGIFHRHLRQLTVEDSRFGIGLGMVIIRSVAANHGGTVLIDQPAGKGTRITMTMMIRQDGGNMLRSPVMNVDYTGGYDRMLLELSECLPPSFYEQEL